MEEHGYHSLSHEEWTLPLLYDIIQQHQKLKISDDVRKSVAECRRYLDEKIKNSDKPVYGINTGFGSLYKVKIHSGQLSELQENLVMSHACGTGEEVPAEIVKIILLLKIKSLSYAHSGIRVETLERLVDFYNNDILPVIYTQGSLGASGDLAPLAHLALVLIGKGEAYFQGKKISGEKLHEQLGIEPLRLHSKEGLALLNGTQFMSAYGIYLLMKSYKLAYFADLIAALSLDAYDGRIEPFDELIHSIRPHRGQRRTAVRVREFLEGSRLIVRTKKHVQDPYSFRCVPQVHGASYDTLEFVKNTLLIEVNSVTDNPNIFVEEDKILSGGNFHGQPLALALDYLGIAMAELGNISERRTYQLISGQRGLPAFLVAEPGINSGFMIPQYTAASIVSMNKQLAVPSSTDSIVSSNGQEDHVSMGANAAVKAYRIIENVQTILGIELLNASQAMYFREKDGENAVTSEFLRNLLTSYRRYVPVIEKDEILHNAIQKSRRFIEETRFDAELLFD